MLQAANCLSYTVMQQRLLRPWASPGAPRHVLPHPSNRVWAQHCQGLSLAAAASRLVTFAVHSCVLLLSHTSNSKPNHLLFLLGFIRTPSRVAKPPFPVLP